MAKIKAHEVDGFLSRTATGYRIFLVYGPDRGLVSERAALIAKAAKVPLDDPFAVIKLDGSTVNSDPARLLDECLTVSMFGGDRLVWLKDAGNERGLVEAVKTVSKAPLEGVTLIVEADDLKPSSGLRSTCESADTIMTLPCYSDDAKAVDMLIDRELAKEGLTISLDARQVLKASLGGDRLATRGELEKLALYCRGQKQVSLADVEAAIGDVSENSADELVDAMLGGDPAKTDEFFSQLISRGTNMQAILSTVTRQLSGFLEQRDGMERDGKSAAAAVAAARPPVFFTRKALVERILAGTSAETLLSYLGKVQAAVLDSRKNAALAEAIVNRTLLAIAASQNRVRQRR